MAKLSLINREKKREDLVAKFASKRAELQAIVDDSLQVCTLRGILFDHRTALFVAVNQC